MQIVVCVKQVGVLGDEVEFTSDGTAVDPEYLESALNEWDAYAVEEALKIRDAVGGEVVAVTCGDEDAEAVLRRCLAMGVDRAVRVDAELDADALAPARALADVVREEQPQLVLCGAQSSDAANAATASALAGLLDLPAVAVVRQLEVDAAGSGAVVHRELEGGVVDVVEVDLPAVVSVQTGINSPRYATLRAIRQAEEHDVPIREAVVTSTTTVQAMRHPPRSGTATMLTGAPAEIAQRIAELVRERVA